MTRRKLIERLGGLFAGLFALAAGLLGSRAKGSEVVRDTLPPCHDEGPTICGRYAQLRAEDGGFLVPEEVMADLKRIRAGFTPEQLAYDGPYQRDEDYEPNELWSDADEDFHSALREVWRKERAKAGPPPESAKAFADWFMAGPMGGRRA